MANDLFEIEGFDQLNKKLERLPDSIKRTEILKIQRRLAKPIVAAYANRLPKGSRVHGRYVNEESVKSEYFASLKKSRKTGKGRIEYQPGNLKKSVRAKTVGKRAVEGNPMIQILPDKTSRADGYYRFMVVRKGFKGSGRGSRKGANTVVHEARNATWEAMKGHTTQEAIDKTAAYIQKRIDQLK